MTQNGRVLYNTLEIHEYDVTEVQQMVYRNFKDISDAEFVDRITIDQTDRWEVGTIDFQYVLFIFLHLI